MSDRLQDRFQCRNSDSHIQQVRSKEEIISEISEDRKAEIPQAVKESLKKDKNLVIKLSKTYFCLWLVMDYNSNLRYPLA